MRILLIDFSPFSPPVTPISIGYLGAALFGGVLLVATNRSTPRMRRWLAIGLGAFFALMTLLFARSVIAIFVCGLAALALLALARYGSRLWLTFGLNLLLLGTVRLSEPVEEERERPIVLVFVRADAS